MGTFGNSLRGLQCLSCFKRLQRDVVVAVDNLIGVISLYLVKLWID